MKISPGEFELSYVRSSGPGGQNVNKVNSKCLLKWNPTHSQCISGLVLARFLERYSSRISADGNVIITSDRFRDQKRNYMDCVEKLEAMLSAVAHPPKLRKKTKATRSSQRRRMDEKRVHSDKKKGRGGGWD